MSTPGWLGNVIAMLILGGIVGFCFWVNAAPSEITMTDKERKQLINSLRNYQGYDKALRQLVHDAADEIEELIKENKKLRDYAELWRLRMVQNGARND